MQVSRSILVSLTLFSLTAAGALVAPAPAFAQDEFDPFAVDDTDTAEPDDAGDSAGADDGDSSGEADISSGWFRVDSDRYGLQFWAGADYTLGGIDLATDIYLIGSTAILDVGPKLSFDDLEVVPMAGFVFNFAAYELSALLAPQLYIYYTGPVYFESWVQFGLTTPFVDNSQNFLYTRNFALYEVNDWLQIGPQLEMQIALNESIEGLDDGGLQQMPLGVRLNLAYGKNTTLGLFFGYETQETINDQHLTGRFTYIHTWGD